MDYMEYRSIIFYISLFLSVLSLAELYVRIKGIGERVEKVRGETVAAPPKLGPTILLLIAAIAISIMTMPR